MLAERDTTGGNDVVELVALTDHNKLNVEISKNVSVPKSYSVRTLLEKHEMLALKRCRYRDAHCRL